jgi:predicted ribosomally synthesized peptide with nif11-like leader
MSVVRAQELIGKVATEPSFRKELEAAPTPEAKSQVIAAHGFSDVSKTDLEAVTKAGNAELSDAELETVAGGKTSTWILVSLAAVALL